jgi:hypothetical protein
VQLPRIFRKEYRGPIFLGAVLTFVIWNAFGFGWFGLPSLGFVTAGGATQLADARMEKVAIPLAAQLCAIRFNEQSPAIIAEKRGKLEAATYSFAKSQQLDPAWVRLGDSRNENQDVVDACVKLILAAQIQKSSELQK